MLIVVKANTEMNSTNSKDTVKPLVLSIYFRMTVTRLINKKQKLVSIKKKLELENYKPYLWYAAK